jgi:Fic family protein
MQPGQKGRPVQQGQRGRVATSAEDTETSRRILALREEHRALVTSNLGRAAGNGHRVLEHLFQRPILSVADVIKLTGTTFPAANNVVSRLAKHGIVQEITGQKRNRLFRYEPYIALFAENPPPEPAPPTAIKVGPP